MGIRAQAAWWVAAALSVTGCGHGSMSDQMNQASAQFSSGFEDAYDAVRSGARQTATWGQYAIDRVGDGAVRIYREAGERAQVAGREVSDAAVTAKVKTNLARDPEVASTNIHVTTDAGSVLLEGTVRNGHEAARAVHDVLATSGVFAVTSRLEWSHATVGGGGTM